MKFIDMTGQRFGKLLVLERHYEVGQTKWRCLCDCGKITTKIGILLRKGQTKSCGCIVKTHGQSAGGKRTKTYMVWDSMISRCENPMHQAWDRYGGRGIKVCDRWKIFQNFFEDMGEQPEGLWLDRIDNDLGYSKENCRWADMKTQQRNKSTNRFVEWRGQSKTVIEWSELIGWDHSVICSRLFAGESGEALFRPRRRHNYDGDVVRLEAAIKKIFPA